MQDYLGTPIQALDSKGKVVWDCLLDIYGEIQTLRGELSFVSFRFQGQYEDEETGLTIDSVITRLRVATTSHKTQLDWQGTTLPYTHTPTIATGGLTHWG